MICAHCGAEIPEDVSFCTKCGKPVEKLDSATTKPLETIQIENPIFCQHCGAKLPEDAAFCSQCGKPVKDVSAPDITETMATAAAVPLTAAAASTAPMPADLAQEQSKTADDSTTKPDTSSSKNSNNGSSHTRILVIIIIILVVLLLALAFFLFDPFGISPSSKDAETATNTEEATSSDKQEPENQNSNTSDEEENDDSDATDTQDEEEFPEEVQEAIDGETPDYPTDIQSAMASPDGYIMNLDSNYMTASAKSALGNLTDVELCLVRNEIYARHGRMFDTDWIQQYFDSKNWYEPEYTPEEFDALSDPLNKYEKANIEDIKEVEKSRNSPYLK